MVKKKSKPSKRRKKASSKTSKTTKASPYKKYIKIIAISLVIFIVLGFVVGFIKGQFAQITSQSEHDKYTCTYYSSSTQKMSFPSSKITLKTNSEDYLAVGIKNIENETKYLSVSFQIKDGSEFKYFTSKEELTLNDNTKAKLTWNDKYYPLESYEPKVIPFNITAPNKLGDYTYKITSWKSDDENGTNKVEYDSVEFTLITTNNSQK